MTTTATDSKRVPPGERTQLPAMRCFYLAARQLGPVGTILALPLLLALLPAAAVRLGWVDVGATAEPVVYAGSLFGLTVASVAVCRRVTLRVSGEPCHADVVAMRPLLRNACVVFLVIFCTTAGPFLIAGFQSLAETARDGLRVFGYVFVAVWCLLWPLAVSALAVERCDAVDALSRAVHFLLSRPVAVVFRLGLSTFAACAIIALGWMLTALGTQIPLIIAIIQATSFLVSCYLLTYLYLREQVDAIEWDEVTTASREPERIPLSGRAAAARRNSAPVTQGVANRIP